MTTSQTDPEYLSNVLVDALALGDKGAAKKWSISVRTVERYRALAKADPEIAALVKDKNAATSHDLATLRVAFLRDALEEMRKKLPSGSLYDVAGAMKVVGELHATAMMIEDGGEEPDAASIDDGEAQH